MKILITGASRGIGLFLLKEMSDDGHEVFGSYNSTEPPNELKEHFAKVDVTDFLHIQNG